MEDREVRVGMMVPRVRRVGESIYVGTEFIGSIDGWARKYAEAILEIIGDEPKPKGDDCYIALLGKPNDWIGQKVFEAISSEVEDPIRTLARSGRAAEFHIFRRVATVGPIPQPSERKVTRYE